MHSRWLVIWSVALAVSVPSVAWAQNGFNFGPDNGRQMQRGSAWVARADDPLATYFNPAGLARQRRALIYGGHLLTMNRCFERITPAGERVSPGGGLPAPGTPNGPPAAVCQDKTPYLNAQVAAAFRLTDRVVMGVAVLGPHGMGKLSWPESVEGPTGPQPSPSRFILVDEDAILAFPTVSLGYQVSDTLSIGAGFTWGFMFDKASAFAEAVSPPPPAGQPPADDFYGHQELKLFLDVKDRFAPGVVLGLLWSPRPDWDIGAWYKQNNTLTMKTTLTLQTRYWTEAGVPNPTPCGPGEPADCNITDAAGPDTEAFFPIPTEFRAGARYHRPRPGADVGDGYDPLTADVFDLEFDVAWANNSSVSAVSLEIDRAGLPLNGVDGVSTVPASVDITKKWEDMWSFRFGGEYVVTPGKFAVQAGTFFETKGQKDADIHNHFDLAAKGGFSGGMTFRKGPFDFSLAYQHVLWADLDNGGHGDLKGLSGDPTTDHSTRQITNGGRLTSSMNEFAASLYWRF